MPEGKVPILGIIVIARCLGANAAVIKGRMTANPRLDTNAAWQSAHAAVSGNRDALLAIAGVFFFLPSLAFVLLYPEPPMAQQAMTPEQAWAFFETFYRESLPFTLAMSLAQTVGAMAVLRLFAGPRRSTVGNAIGRGAVDAIVFMASVFAASIAFSIVASILFAVFALTGLKAVAGAAAVLLIAVALYLFFRLILVMPAIAVEGLRSPLVSFRRSWDLTRGNVGRIVLFLVLLLLAYAVVTAVASAVLGLGLALALGTAGSKIAVGIVTSALGAVFTLYVFAVLAAIHRQLAGPSPSDLRQTFD